jgi:hypothetical protein
VYQLRSTPSSSTLGLGNGGGLSYIGASEAVVIVDRIFVGAGLGASPILSGTGEWLFDPHDPVCAVGTPIGLDAPRRSAKQQ